MSEILFGLIALALALLISSVLAAARSALVNASKSRLRQMRDEGAVKFDIHKGVWNI